MLRCSSQTLFDLNTSIFHSIRRVRTHIILSKFSTEGGTVQPPRGLGRCRGLCKYACVSCMRKRVDNEADVCKSLTDILLFPFPLWKRENVNSHFLTVFDFESTKLNKCTRSLAELELSRSRDEQAIVRMFRCLIACPTTIDGYIR